MSRFWLSRIALTSTPATSAGASCSNQVPVPSSTTSPGSGGSDHWGDLPAALKDQVIVRAGTTPSEPTPHSRSEPLPFIILLLLSERFASIAQRVFVAATASWSVFHDRKALRIRRGILSSSFLLFERRRFHEDPSHCFHPDRASGRDRHHRGVDRLAAAGCASGARSCPPRAVYQQPQTASAWPFPITRPPCNHFPSARETIT